MSKVPYADVLAGRDPRQVIAETPSRWRCLLDEVSDAEADVPTAPGKWSLREIVAHMADCELAWGWRLRQALSEDHSLIQPFDQDRWARAYEVYTFADAKTTFFTLRKWNIAFINVVTEEEKRKPVTHPVRGEETLWTLAEILAGHDLHHLQRLEVLTQA